MFLSHFQLQTQPFAEHTPVERLWNDERMTQGLARLQYLVDGGTLGLVSGSTGLGKSALLRAKHDPLLLLPHPPLRGGWGRRTCCRGAELVQNHRSTESSSEGAKSLCIQRLSAIAFVKVAIPN